MKASIAKNYYSREEIQKAFLNFAKNRELGACFDGFYGKRPDTIEYISDVKTLVKKGIFSFHFSEERWANPLLLGNQNLSEEERAKNRIGWDLILDLDGVDFEYAKIVGKIIIDYLNKIGIKNVSTKFSGNKGFHLGIPFEAFSQHIIGIGETRNLFPDIARKIASFLMYELRDKITKTILEKDKSVENISKKYNIPIPDLLSFHKGKREFNYMKVIEVDTILISTRHLFRSPYSLHEKSELVSIPVRNDRIVEFEKEEAKPVNVNPKEYEEFDFLKYKSEHGKDADILLIKALEADISPEEIFIDPENLKSIQKRHTKNVRANEGKIIFDSDIEYSTLEIKEEVKRNEFPQTINFILDSDFPDGKKRAVFVLLTYLHAINWQKENIEILINEWNEKQNSKLKNNYVKAQLSWFENQSKKISPPNFKNDNYYKSIGITKEIIQKDQKQFKEKIKNPLHCTFLFLQQKEAKKEKKSKNKENKDKKSDK